MNKKLKKFLRNPSQFLKDMYLKRTGKLAVISSSKAVVASSKKLGNYKYTVISPVYNVGEYLEEYFNSLVNQKLSFKDNIRVVLVDDGSTDNSKSIIQEWQQRYPENIVFLSKENGGPGSARNIALDYVKNISEFSAPSGEVVDENGSSGKTWVDDFEKTWVTFIDPDDFVDLKYFLEVDVFLGRNRKKNINLLNSNIISYVDENKRFSDTHLLRFRFSNKDVTFPLAKLGKHVNAAVGGAFFPLSNLLNFDLRFDERLRPNFEDTHFVSCYIANLKNGEIAFSARAKYFHRKRLQSFLMPNVPWDHPGLYGDVLEYGCLDVFNKFKELKGAVPEHIQRVVLFNLLWYIKKALNNTELIDFLSEAERERFLFNFEALFSYIEPETISKFELGGCGLFHKIGMMQLFKNLPPVSQFAYLEDYDFKKSQVLVRYYTGELPLEVFLVDGKDTLPHFAKTVRHSFFGRTFYLERRVWLPLRKSLGQKTLRIKLGSYDSKISMGKNTYSQGVKASDVVAHFLKERPKHKITPQYANSWILMDRDNQADDNAEHMYRYIQRNHPEQLIYFVLSRESHDWSRLDAEGFNLLAFGSPEHEAALHSCSKIISSHAAQFVTDYFKDKSLRSKHFVFLQHGVIHNDQASLFAPAWKKFDAFITSGKGEYESIAGDFGRYKFTTKEVKLTGLPRHDALMLSEIKPERIILVMPTWRVYLLGKVISGTERELLPDFSESEYAMRWNSLLNSDRLLELARTHGYKIIFFPHANIQPYLSQFALPPEVEVLDHSNSSIQELFLRSALMVTDYSSVAFETAYLRKPVCYYQFDEEDFFRRGHYSKGYFDYRENGFGPVVTEESDLIDALEHLLNQDAKSDPLYQQRVEDFFPFRDGKCCERVYDAIISLDKPMEPNFIQENIVLPYAEAASKLNSWTLAIRRWKLALRYHLGIEGGMNQVLNDQLELACALRHSGRLKEAALLMDEILSESACAVDSDSGNIDERVAIEKARLRMADYDWEGALTYLQPLHQTLEVQKLIFQCKAEIGQEADAEQFSSLMELETDLDASVSIDAWLAMAQRDWTKVIEILSENNEVLVQQPSLCLLLIRAYRKVGDISAAMFELKRYEDIFSRDRHWLIETIKIRFEKNRLIKITPKNKNIQTAQVKQLLTLLKKAYPEGIIGMPVEDGLIQVRAKRMLGDIRTAQSDIEILQSKSQLITEVAREAAELAQAQKKWPIALAQWDFLAGHAEYVPYSHVLALRKLGQVEEAYEVLTREWDELSPMLKAWEIRAELSEILGNYNDVAFCWEFIVRNFSSNMPVFSFDRLYQARMMNSVSSGKLSVSSVKAIEMN